MNDKVVLYGAGEHASLIFKRIKEIVAPREVIAFIDGDITKQGKNFFGLPIMSFDEANEKFGNFYIYISANERNAPEIIGQLLERGISAEWIINYEPVEKRVGCSLEGTLLVHFIGEFISLTACDCISQGGENRIRREIEISPNNFNTKTLCNAMEQIEGTFLQIQTGSIPKGCESCQFIKKQYYYKQKKIRRLMLGGYTACNYKCLHCTNTELFGGYKYSVYDDLKNVIEVMELSELLDRETVIAFGVGEFTVNKRHINFLKQLGKYPLMLFTNGYILSEGIAECLNSGSALVYISVDAGTRETYKKIKGVDGFEQVCNHLRRYAKHGMVVLKYIMYEGINTNTDDIEGFYALAKEVADRVVVSRDFYAVNSLSNDTLALVADFITHFRETGQLSGITGYKRTDENEILNKLLKRK